MPYSEYYWHSVSHFNVCMYFVHYMKRIRVREIIVALWMRKEIGKTTGKSRQSVEETMSSEWHVRLTHSVERNCVWKICVINYVVNYQVLWCRPNALIILSQKLVQFEWTYRWLRKSWCFCNCHLYSNIWPVNARQPGCNSFIMHLSLLSDLDFLPLLFACCDSYEHSSRRYWDESEPFGAC